MSDDEGTEVTFINGTSNVSEIAEIDTDSGEWVVFKIITFKITTDGGPFSQNTVSLPAVGVYGMGPTGSLAASIISPITIPFGTGLSADPTVAFGWTSDHPTEALWFTDTFVSNYSDTQPGGIQNVTIVNCTTNDIQMWIKANNMFQFTGVCIATGNILPIGFIPGTEVTFNGSNAPLNTNNVYIVGVSDNGKFINVNPDTDMGIQINNSAMCNSGVMVNSSNTNNTGGSTFISHYRWVIILIVIGIIILIIVVIYISFRSGSKEENTQEQGIDALLREETSESNEEEGDEEEGNEEEGDTEEGNKGEGGLAEAEAEAEGGEASKLEEAAELA